MGEDDKNSFVFFTGAKKRCTVLKRCSTCSAECGLFEDLLPCDGEPDSDHRPAQLRKNREQYHSISRISCQLTFLRATTSSV